jgi:hypothetical protein
MKNGYQVMMTASVVQAMEVVEGRKEKAPLKEAFSRNDSSY